METKANYAIVGFFTILVIAAAFGFVYWRAQYGRGGPMADLIIRIPGSANGLSVGSPVRFNGITIGSVRSLSIDGKDPNFSIAFTEVKENAPIYSSTKAILEIQGLTGAAYIELSGGKTGDTNLMQAARETGESPVLTADQSSVTNLLATADKIMGKADDTIDDIQGFVRDARTPLTNTVRNAESFTKSLSDNSKGIDEFLKSVASLSETVTKISGRLDSAIETVDRIVKAVDPQKVDRIVANAEKVSNDIAASSGDLSETIKSFRQTAETYNRFGEEAEKALKKVEDLVAAVDAAKIRSSVDNASATMADARAAAASIRGVTDDIQARRKQIDDAIANASEITQKLNKASNRVDGILVKVDKLLGSDDANSLFAEARRTLESFKSVADNINARVGPIADNLSRFSSTGLRDVQTLVGETRRTVQSLNDAIGNFDRDPQRLLFGGDNVKTYNGRNRH